MRDYFDLFFCPSKKKKSCQFSYRSVNDPTDVSSPQDVGPGIFAVDLDRVLDAIGHLGINGVDAGGFVAGPPRVETVHEQVLLRNCMNEFD